MKERLGIVLLTALSLCACNEEKNSSGVDGSAYQNRSMSVFGQLRPKSDPNVIRQMQAEEEAARQAQIAEMERQQKEAQDAAAKAQAQASLPSVDTSPISGSIQPVNGVDMGYQNQANQISQSWSQPPVPSAPPPSSYGINYSQPSAGFVPPPPAVSLSTSAVPMGYPPPGYDPYANPYGFMQQQQAPAQMASAGRPAGSPFGSASRASSSDEDDDDKEQKKKEKPIQIITPTGMESRSPYKQRDELRILWRGAISTALARINANGKFADGLSKVDVGLPTESSKGSLSVSQRQVDKLFKNNSGLDEKVVGTVRKVQTDLVQSYYRYLYAYNKFFLTQQQVAARKQELDYAESQAEKQRATSDLAQSQQEADSSKEDMKSAQSDLASVVGAQAARSVIKAVSGVSPNLEAIAQAEPAQAQAQDGGTGGFGGILNVFGIGNKPKKEGNEAEAEDVQIASDENGKEKKKEKKEKKKDKGDKGEKGESDSKRQIASRAPAPTSSSKADSADSSPLAEAAKGPVSFELREVKTTPRKSVLRVIVKNTGGDNFSFDADSISVAEGNNKLAEAAVRAEFDSTVVQPSQEVTGTITIFGRPWNDKLTVSLSSGNKPILLHR